MHSRACLRRCEITVATLRDELSLKRREHFFRNVSCHGLHPQCVRFLFLELPVCAGFCGNRLRQLLLHLGSRPALLNRAGPQSIDPFLGGLTARSDGLEGAEFVLQFARQGLCFFPVFILVGGRTSSFSAAATADWRCCSRPGPATAVSGVEGDGRLTPCFVAPTGPLAANPALPMDWGSHRAAPTSRLHRSGNKTWGRRSSRRPHRRAPTTVGVS